MLDQEHRQIQRWSLTEAIGQRPVKGSEPDRAALAGAHAQIVFPILSVAPSARQAGIVCLDGRLRAFVARTVRLRDYDTLARRREVLLEQLAHELAERSPGVVVIETGFNPTITPVSRQLAEAAAEATRNAGFRVLRRSLASSCRRVATDGTVRSTAALLVRRYDTLARRLAPKGTLQLHNERWRESKALVTALALAHATGLDVLAAVTGPPPPRP